MRAICKNCGHDGIAERKLKSHFLITLVLLFFWLIPGIIHIIWRRTGLRDSCVKCGSTEVVARNSPEGERLLALSDMSETHVKCPDCRELVFRDASKCKHCGTALVPQ